VQPSSIPCTPCKQCSELHGTYVIQAILIIGMQSWSHHHMNVILRFTHEPQPPRLDNAASTGCRNHGPGCMLQHTTSTQSHGHCRSPPARHPPNTFPIWLSLPVRRQNTRPAHRTCSPAKLHATHFCSDWPGPPLDGPVSAHLCARGDACNDLPEAIISCAHILLQGEERCTPCQHTCQRCEIPAVHLAVGW